MSWKSSQLDTKSLIGTFFEIFGNVRRLVYIDEMLALNVYFLVFYRSVFALNWPPPWNAFSATSRHALAVLGNDPNNVSTKTSQFERIGYCYPSMPLMNWNSKR